MTMHARNQQRYIQQPFVNPRPNQPEPVKKQEQKIFSKGEKFLFIMFITAVALFGIMILQTQSSIHTSTKEIQTINQQIEETQKQNTDLSIHVSELSTYERIWEKAKDLGLRLNEQNVKVVTGQ